MKQLLHAAILTLLSIGSINAGDRCDRCLTQPKPQSDFAPSRICRTTRELVYRGSSSWRWEWTGYRWELAVYDFYDVRNVTRCNDYSIPR